MKKLKKKKQKQDPVPDQKESNKTVEPYTMLGSRHKNTFLGLNTCQAPF